jgi:hypothetical protein
VRLAFTLAIIVLIGPSAALAEENLLATLRKEHPRLLVLDDELPRVREAMESDKVARRWARQLRTSADKLLNEPPTPREFIGKRMLAASRQVLNRVVTLAGMYRLTGDERYARRAADELLAVAKYQDWNPPHFLDTAEMTNAFGIGYDWLYSYLTPDERATIKQAIIEKGLKPGLAVYASEKGWHKITNNWNQVCNGGMTVGALAIADEEPEIVTRVLRHARESIPLALKQFEPDGGCIEGPSYWAYAARYTTFFFAALQTALNTDFDLLKSPGLAQAGDFRMHSIGPIDRSFNFADASDGIREASCMFWMARAFDRPVYAAHERAMFDRQEPDPFHLMWFNSAGTDEQMRVAPPAIAFGRIDVALMRSAWNDRNAAFVGFKGGTNGASHSHLDLGSFVYDVDGLRWALDLGSDDYNLPGYFGRQRWTYYRLRTEGHNTLTINGENQQTPARAPLIGFEGSEGSSFAVADLTAGYAKPVEKVHRTVRLNGRAMLVEDELTAAEPVEVVWNFHTPASVSISDDGRRATLKQKDKMLYGTIMQAPPGARFETISANPPPPQKQQPGVTNLIVRLSNVKQLELAIQLSPDLPQN